MRDDDAALSCVAHSGGNQQAIGMGQFQTILSHHLDQPIGQRNPRLRQQSGNTAVNYLVFGQRVEIIFVNGAASGEDKD